MASNLPLMSLIFSSFGITRASAFIKLNTMFSNNEGKMFKGLVTNAQDLKIQILKQSNAEIQFYELTQWLSKIIIASFGLSPQDVGLTMDINRSTGEVQKAITKSQAISDLLALKREFWEKILMQLSEKNTNFLYIEYENEQIDKIDEKQQAEIDKLYMEIVLAFNNAGLEIPQSILDKTDFGELEKKEVEEVEEIENVEEKKEVIEEEKPIIVDIPETKKRINKEIKNLIKWYK
jgi:capsid portal protein